MQKIKALSISDVKGGKPYICVEVWMNNSMHLYVKTFCGVARKQKDTGWWIRASRSFSKVFSPKDWAGFHPYRSVSSLGLDSGYYCNDHRVFDFNTDNLRVIGDLVRRQDITAYLDLIGVSGEAAKENRESDRELSDVIREIYCAREPEDYQEV